METYTEENKLSIWHLEQLNKDESMISRAATLLENEPRQMCEVHHTGDVTDLSYLSLEVLAAASSTGDLSLYRHDANNQTLTQSYQWEKLHWVKNQSCPCTCLATRGEEMLVTGGEDGRLIVLAVGHTQPITVFDNADSCTINGVTFLKQSEVATVNSFGQLKIYDLRQKGEAAKTFSAMEEHIALQCVDQHPSQSYILATGGRDGMLTIWDLRQEKFPMTLLEAHNATLWEVKFHPTNPDHLFTCSDNGSLWHWDGTLMTSSNTDIHTGSQIGLGGLSGGDNAQRKVSNRAAVVESHNSPWLTLESSRHKLDITSLLPTKSLPVNSLDIEGNALICGTDSETIYTVCLAGLLR
ncbi:nucleoporin Nup43-like isoform X2 [Gigantopelta aegis]|uniref:nucleoporin Nup43-like isoform X2 n=1 Tax=Gigantopelta aegis TaxID=1735272 RepID=UPI001B88B249|nr:nucleoporin Nup43-like isoform X2 [Gigantopelta aegis]